MPDLCPLEHRMDTMRTFEHTINALYEDSDITGDLLLIGLWLARATILRHPEPGNGRWSFAAIALTLFGRGRGRVVPAAGMKVPRHLLFRVEDAVRKDVPRYDPFIDNRGEARCDAPMPRAPYCRLSVTSWGFVTDPATGRSARLSVCGRRDHQAWERQRRAEINAQLEDLGDKLPKPPANAGGRLERHIRLRSWPTMYRRLSPDWMPPAEDAPTARPTLTVLRNDDFEALEPSDRPALVVHEGGWR